MRVPMRWLREYVELPPDIDGRTLASRLIQLGLEVETVETYGEGISGPIVAGRVIDIEELTEFKKPIRYCQVDVGDDHGGVRGIVCGASNFALNDIVAVALPGATLPGGFAISARETYGRTSDGMICADRELGIGDDGAGIMVLDGKVAPGTDLVAAFGFGDEILDIAVTPDRGYALAMRGVAREAAIGFDVSFHDPADVMDQSADDAQPVTCKIEDAAGCDVFTLRTIGDVDRSASTPLWMRTRLTQSGMRPISLVVDVTNYVMLEMGQPLHAFDRNKISEQLVARRAASDEKLVTLDHVERALNNDDLVIADSSGAQALAGTMGGLDSEMDAESTSLALEAAHFDASTVARMSRRHKLSSEASRRFERGVDPMLPTAASARAMQLLSELAGAKSMGWSEVNRYEPPSAIAMSPDKPGNVAGMEIDIDTVVANLEKVGCSVTRGGDALSVTPPTWRPDLTDPADLVEEVLRLIGYDNIPARLPQARPGTGLTIRQQHRRRVAKLIAARGFIDVLNYPFIGPTDLDALNLPAQDPRRDVTTLVNPLADTAPNLRSTLLPGLLAAAKRNLSRGADRIALTEIGLVFVNPGPRADNPPRPSVDRRPSDSELAQLNQLLPDQPLHLAGVWSGAFEPKGWWGPARAATWADPIELVRVIGDELGVSITVEAGSDAPFHPGRCAQLSVEGQVIGFAGELHPRVVAATGLPERSAACEVNLDVLLDAATAVTHAPTIITMPLAKEDVAVVVDESVSAYDVQQALVAGAGELLESIRLFDTYSGSQVSEGKKSLAFALRFRAPDRTLELAEVSQARDAAVANAEAKVGAVLRS